MAENGSGPGDAGEGRAKRSAAEDVGRAAGKLVRSARPRLARLFEQGEPQVEKAGREALRYAADHRDELTRTALRATRARFRGPLGLVLDGLSRAVAPPDGEASGEKGGTAADRACPGCSAVNARAARFCNQCGAALPPNAG